MCTCASAPHAARAATVAAVANEQAPQLPDAAGAHGRPGCGCERSHPRRHGTQEQRPTERAIRTSADALLFAADMPRY